MTSHDLITQQMHLPTADPLLGSTVIMIGCSTILSVTKVTFTFSPSVALYTDGSKYTVTSAAEKTGMQDREGDSVCGEYTQEGSGVCMRVLCACVHVLGDARSASLTVQVHDHHSCEIG